VLFAALHESAFDPDIARCQADVRFTPE